MVGRARPRAGRKSAGGPDGSAVGQMDLIGGHICCAIEVADEGDGPGIGFGWASAGTEGAAGSPSTAPRALDAS